MKRNILLILLFLSLTTNAQFIRNFGVNDTTLNTGKVRFISISLGTVYGGAIAGLSTLWYDSLSGFRFFNDNAQWSQIDKLGHFSTAFHESRLAIDLLKWSGVKHKKAALIGSLGGFIFQTPIEILDGFSPSFGASWGDIIANTAGSGLVLAQEIAWNDIYIQTKFSFHTTPYASQRPNTLGNGLNEQIIKDYNGQTHWLSANLYPIFNSKSKFPRWLNIAVGYGANGMLFGSPTENRASGNRAYRQWYISPDIDLTKIPTKKKGLKILFYGLNVIKVPLPALEFNRDKKIVGHLLYF